MAEVSDVIRTRRLEVVDERGRVRVVLGFIGRGEGPIFGVAIQDESGRGRVWMLHDGAAAEVGLDHGGNVVAALSVADNGTPSLFLED